MLAAELERAQTRGEGFPGADLILTELRRATRAHGSPMPPIGDQARLFFEPLEPFLVDSPPDHEPRGRIARSALEPIWLWLSNTVMPEEVRAFCNDVEQALLSGDEAKANEIAHAFQDRAALCMREAVDSAAGNDKAARRLAAQLGTPRALEDVQAVIGVLQARDELALLGKQLPVHIRNLTGVHLDNVKALLDSRLASDPDLFFYALIVAMSRMAAPWQLIRLAIEAGGGDDAERIADTPYALAIALVLAEMERMVAELGAELQNGCGVAVITLLKDVHDAVRCMRTELDLSGHPQWQRQLAAVRAEISELISAEIELLPGRIRRLMRPLPVREAEAEAPLDENEVADLEGLLDFFLACRDYAGELAVNELTQRILGEMQQSLDTGTQTLLDALRNAGDAERTVRQAQLSAAVRLCAKVFGREYASLLTKAAEVAIHGDRKAAHA